jgi:hypothetical protein
MDDHHLGTASSVELTAQKPTRIDLEFPQDTSPRARFEESPLYLVRHETLSHRALPSVGMDH